MGGEKIVERVWDQLIKLILSINGLRGGGGGRIFLKSLNKVWIRRFQRRNVVKQGSRGKWRKKMMYLQRLYVQNAKVSSFY